MRTHAARKKISEEGYSTTLVVVLLLILPQFGAAVMEIGAAVGMAVYLFLFPERFRNHHGSLVYGFVFVSILAALAVAAVVVSLGK